MAKEKKSFLEKLSGSRRVEDNEEEYSTPIFADDESSEEMVMNANNFSDNSSYEPSEDHSGDAEGQLTIDVYQTDSDVIIKSTIAGVKPEDLDVSINNDMITIKGERKNEELVQDEDYYYQECYWGGFSRSVVLPVEVLPDKIEASLKNGILTIRLPKADTTKTKKIQVRGF